MKKRLWVIVLPLFLMLAISVLLLTSNPVSSWALSTAKVNGYIAYTPEEATTLAYTRCTTCHQVEKIIQYCSRCGPPFAVVTNTMRKFVQMANLETKRVEQFTDAELVAITQVWNALVGNWEGDWRKQDIKRLLGNDQALIDLIDTAVEDRPIEAALKNKTAPGSYKEIQSFGVK
ncbi:hypothetical protein MNBD_GAMMA26-872 [hydrothermal vent metagenome]|uniref:Uncharacterized protein n=1 Tax=hydrothermal vent metagenome TaxID=652676 RepID=A0A3B1BGN7_9ZZZZ